MPTKAPIASWSPDHRAIVRLPSNNLNNLRGSLIEIIGPSTDVRYNLAWSFGDYLHNVPQRLGLNASLDAAASAVVSAHTDHCAKRYVTEGSLLKYSHALKTLRASLDDPITARSSETLCAVMLLLVYQGLVGSCEGAWTGHCEGAAQLLKARGYGNMHDPFEGLLLMTVRGPLVSLLFRGCSFRRADFRVAVRRHV